jgi:transcriptional regulator with XRE-family HTH domain
MPQTPSDIELGRRVAQLREQRGMKQAELARRITWSTTVMSRVEAGDRPISAEELKAIVESIGTPDAFRLAEIVGREWVVLERPDLDHPDQDLLFEAERVAVDLQRLIEAPNVRQPFGRRVIEYIGELQRISRLLLRRQHQIAFIGSIGVGKSTAICRVAGLEVKDSETGESVPVLEVGGGGITLCEVFLRSGPGYGLVIEPRSDEEIREDVSDFAERLLRGERPRDGSNPEADGGRGVSQEIDRAIRNMANLKVRRPKEQGKTVKRDDAKELAQKFPSLKELVVQILAKMELHRRDKRDLWYEDDMKESPLEWLQKTFMEINNGRHPDVSLPKRIEMVVPHDLLEVPDLNVSMIDTRGIDETASRGDLEAYLEEPHTTVVLCSKFNDAPSLDVQAILERAKEVGNTQVNTNAAILVLPRPKEALAVKDEVGTRVESDEEGYELKGEQVSNKLEPLGMNLNVGFFNALSDDPALLQRFLTTQIGEVREHFRSSLREVIDTGRMLLENHEREQVQEVLRAAGRLIHTFLTEHEVPAPIDAHVQDSLLSVMATSHPSTIHACVRRHGEWLNLSYSHQLGHGARRIAVLSLGEYVAHFRDYCKTLSKSGDLAEARELLLQAGRLMAQLYEEILRRIQLLGQNLFKEALRQDVNFWADCAGEWGEGPGYRIRVTNTNRRWFWHDDRRLLETELGELIAREWAQAVSRVSSLVEAL